MAASSQYAKVYNIPLDFFVQRMRYIQTSGLGMEMRGEAPVMGGLQFFLKHGVSLTSWGENVTVFLTDQGGATNVTIRSECALATQIVDWARIRKTSTVSLCIWSAIWRLIMRPAQHSLPMIVHSRSRTRILRLHIILRRSSLPARSVRTAAHRRRRCRASAPYAAARLENDPISNSRFCTI